MKCYLSLRKLTFLSGSSAGWETYRPLADYPYLEPDDVTAALEFAARQSDHPILRSA
jgi:uncharacterized protein (DUF433 family)